MAQWQGPYTLATTGSTGNNTHTGIRQEADAELQLAAFKVEAVGATPTVTFQLQGSMNSTTGTDGDWYDLSTIPGDSGTEANTSTRTAVGTYGAFVALHKFGQWIRLKTTLNTNVTYSCTLYTQDSD